MTLILQTLSLSSALHVSLSILSLIIPIALFDLNFKHTHTSPVLDRRLQSSIGKVSDTMHTKQRYVSVDYLQLFTIEHKHLCLSSPFDFPSFVWFLSGLDSHMLIVLTR